MSTFCIEVSLGRTRYFATHRMVDYCLITLESLGLNIGIAGDLSVGALGAYVLDELLCLGLVTSTNGYNRVRNILDAASGGIANHIGDELGRDT